MSTFFRRLTFDSAAELPSPLVEWGREFISSHLCPQPHRFALIPSIGLIGPPWHLFYLFYVGTSDDGPPPPPSSSANEERWIPTGSFALFLPLRSFLVAAI